MSGHDNCPRCHGDDSLRGSYPNACQRCNGYGRVCPVCEAKVIQTCRCFRSDSICENGHKWHFCTQHKNQIIGESDHNRGGCACPPNVRYATINELERASRGKKVVVNDQGQASVVQESAPRFIARLITEDPDVILEQLEDDKFADPRQAWEANVKPEGKHGEVGWAAPVGEDGPDDKADRLVRGQKHDVEVPFDESQQNIIYHTHPVTGDGPSPLRALPSVADLKVTLKKGVTGIGIYNDYYLAKVTPHSQTGSIGPTGHYEQALRQGNFEEAVKALGRLGFNVEIIDSRQNREINET